MARMKYLLGPIRAPFLVITPACVFLGYGSAVWVAGRVSWLHFLLALVGGIAAHISVNALNEYHDYKSGLDMRTRRTPFSGGSGTLPSHPEMAPGALMTGVIALLLTAAIGLYFVSIWGIALLPLGLLGLLLIVVYTRWVTQHPLVCLIAPGLGFGTLMVMGTSFVLTGKYTWTAFFASLVPFFLVSNLLLLNQFPDVEADESVGRRHLPIVIGRKRSVLVYGLFILLAYISIVLGVLLKAMPVGSLLGLGTLVISIPAAVGAYRHAEDIPQLIPSMGRNVLTNILTPVLVAVGFLLGR
jgi:1,4-dihydroxy-2-naphthoate octaprenyltransferase